MSHGADILRATVQARSRLAVCIDGKTELGGNRDLALERLERLADQLLIDEGAIDLGGVEEGDTAFDRGTHERDALLTVGRRPVGNAHAHAAQPQCRDLETALAEPALFHGRVPSTGGVAASPPAAAGRNTPDR